jgi:DNA topoisomerase-2
MEYKKITQEQHVLLRSEIYLGSKTIEKKMEWIMENDKLVEKEIEYSDSFIQLFKEILGNSCDNVYRSRQFDVKPTFIKIYADVETGIISICNDGLTIPVEKSNDENGWIPEMIFSQLLSSSNYNDCENRETVGKNGIGCKAVNITSSLFKIECVDTKNQKKYTQSWENNMTIRREPKISSKKCKNGFTKISWLPDANFFKLSLTNDLVGLFKKIACQTSMYCKVRVYFNDELLKIHDFKDYIQLFPNVSDFVYINTPDSEVLVQISKDDFSSSSFVNGIETKLNGVHVDVWYDAILKEVVSKYKNITIKDVKNIFKIHVCCRLSNPEFTSQSKDKLSFPKPKVIIKPSQIKNILNLNGLVEYIEYVGKTKENGYLKNIEKKTKTFKKIEGYDPANFKGSKKSKQCCLILSEGLSAKTFAVKGIKQSLFGLSGRDYFGILPLRGCLLNVRNASALQTSKNSEITNLIHILGLKIGVDYTNDVNFNTLNYGKVMLLCDSDNDGSHITGLILNFFNFMFPSLMKRNDFLFGMMTPIISAVENKKTKRFYSINEVNNYRKNHVLSNEKYLKGLGSSTDADIKEGFGKRCIQYIHTNDTDGEFVKIFDNKFSNERKEWLNTFNNSDLNLDFTKPVVDCSMEKFLNIEMIKFSIDDCKRNLPNIYDGFKEGQRKIFYASRLKGDASLKVSQLSGFVSEKTLYHHGEQCLNDTIIKMAQRFVGTNNFPLMENNGQFGSRINFKDNASARYIFTKLEKSSFDVFLKKDDDVLEYRMEEGVKIEPEYYMPIIPMILCNGIKSIGTGWSCTIPCFNPKEIVENIIGYLDGKEMKELKPFYKGFLGKIEEIQKGKYKTVGCFEKIKNKVYKITEIPIGVSIDGYKERLEDLLEKKQIKKLKNYSDEVKIHFEVELFHDDFDVELFKLSSLLHTTNMVVIDENNNICKMNTVSDIMTKFCKKRLDYYKKRTLCMIQKYTLEYKTSVNKLRFLECILQNHDILFMNDVDVALIFKSKGIENGDYLLSNTSIKAITKNSIDKLKKNIMDVENYIKYLEKCDCKTIYLEELNQLNKYFY